MRGPRAVNWSTQPQHDGSNEWRTPRVWDYSSHCPQNDEPFSRVNSNTTTATVLTATATVTMSLRACLCFLLSILITSPSAADSFYFLKQVGTGKPCVTCQDISHKFTFPRQAAKDRQERRVPATDRSPVCRVEPGQSGAPCWRGQCVCSCVTLPSQDLALVRRDEEVLDGRGGHHLRVGAGQEEQDWRRRAL